MAAKGHAMRSAFANYFQLLGGIGTTLCSGRVITAQKSISGLNTVSTRGLIDLSKG